MSLPTIDATSAKQNPSNAGNDSGFMVGYSALTPHAAPNGIFSIAGPTSGVARLRYLRFELTGATSVVALLLQLQKSTTVTGGTAATAIVPVALDSGQSITTATSVVKVYTVDPTLAGTNTVIDSRGFPTVNAATGTTVIEFDYLAGKHGDMAPSLRTGDFWTLTLGAGALPSGSTLTFNITAKWDEAAV